MKVVVDEMPDWYGNCMFYEECGKCRLCNGMCTLYAEYIGKCEKLISFKELIECKRH